jgi:hypothetical protein
LPPLAVPATLQDSLLARLDRLATAREIAQIGAAIGREFDYPLLAEVAGTAEAALHDALSQLETGGLISWAMACWCISVIRRRMRTTPSGQFELD